MRQNAPRRLCIVSQGSYRLHRGPHGRCHRCYQRTTVGKVTFTPRRIIYPAEESVHMYSFGGEVSGHPTRCYHGRTAHSSTPTVVVTTTPLSEPQPKSLSLLALEASVRSCGQRVRVARMVKEVYSSRRCKTVAPVLLIVASGALVAELDFITTNW